MPDPEPFIPMWQTIAKAYELVASRSVNLVSGTSVKHSWTVTRGPKGVSIEIRKDA